MKNNRTHKIIMGKKITGKRFRKNKRTSLSSIFRTVEQERLFAQCAKQSMSRDVRLSW